MSNIKNILLIILIVIINSCDSGSSTSPASTPTESVVTIALNGITANNFDQASFVNALAAQLGISPNRITFMGITERNLNIELYFSDPSEGELDTATLLADVVEISAIVIDGTSYNMTAEVNEVATDCAGVPNGTSITDTCGVCDGDGTSCASNDLIDLLQGTWNLTGQCVVGTVYDYNGSCVNYDSCEDFYDTTIEISGYYYTFCDGSPNNCDDATAFSISGNNIVFSDPNSNATFSITVTLSNNNQTVEASGPMNDYGCSATLTETWVKNGSGNGSVIEDPCGLFEDTWTGTTADWTLNPSGCNAFIPEGNGLDWSSSTLICNTSQCTWVDDQEVEQYSCSDGVMTMDFWTGNINGPHLTLTGSTDMSEGCSMTATLRFQN